MGKQYYVYILANKRNGTLYVGVTSNIIKRIWEHKHDMVEWFTKKYKVHMLVYYEIFEDIYVAISREKALKWTNRNKKIELIESDNPSWNDLYGDLCE